MRSVAVACAQKAPTLLEQLDAAHAANDVAAAQKLLNAIYNRFDDTTAAMANTLEGATA
jgi:hypothetical protein